MCEQTEVQYLEGDVVWVKMGKIWWPGEVKDFDKLDEEIRSELKKKPLAVVKFFQEDSFEYVKNLDNIYKYNCRKKHEFIKKGLDLYRKDPGKDFMEKFPGDIIKAEELTNGDPDILSSEEFAPEKKTNYAEIFGSPAKTPKEGKGKARMSQKLSKSADLERKKFQRSYMQKSDYGITYLEQNTPTQTKSNYICHICNYTCTRLNVIILHNKSHIRGFASHIRTPNNTNSKKSTKTNKKQVASRKATKQKFANTSNIDEDIQLIRQGYVLSDFTDSDSNDDTFIEKKSNKKIQVKRVKPQKTTKPPSKKPKTQPTASCSDLLADWSDNENTDTELTPESEKKSKSKSNQNQPQSSDKNLSNALLADWDSPSDTENTENNTENNTEMMNISKELEQENSESEPKEDSQSQKVDYGGLDTPKGNLDTPKGGLGSPRRGFGESKGGLGSPKGGIGSPKGGIGTIGDSDTPKDNLDTPKGDLDTSKKGSDASKGDLTTSKGVLDKKGGIGIVAPKGDSDIQKESLVTQKGGSKIPKGRSDTSKGDSETLKESSDVPKGDSDTPKGSSDIQKKTKTQKEGSKTQKGDLDTQGSSDTPKGSSDTPKGSSDAPKGSSDAPKGSSDTPKGSSDAPKGSSDAPKGSSDTPKGSSDAPKGSSDIQKGDLETKKGGSKTQKSGLETLEAPKGDLDTPKGSLETPKDTTENGRDCFDFKEEEFTVLQKSPGRKIPRVIPHKRKSTTSEPLSSEENQQETSEKTKENQSEIEVDQEAFESLLEETSVPNLPSLETLKSAQNFQLAKPQKSPDKLDTDEKTNGVLKDPTSSRETQLPIDCPIPKKRIFLSLRKEKNESEKSKITEIDSNEPKTSQKGQIEVKSSESEIQNIDMEGKEEKLGKDQDLEVHKLKSQLMTKLQESPTSLEKISKSGRYKRGTQKNFIPEKESIEIQNQAIDIGTQKSIKDPEDNVSKSLEEVPEVPEESFRRGRRSLKPKIQEGVLEKLSSKSSKRQKGKLETDDTEIKVPEGSESFQDVPEKVPETPTRSSRSGSRKDKLIPKEEQKLPELESSSIPEKKEDSKVPEVSIESGTGTGTPTRSSRRKEKHVPKEEQESSGSGSGSVIPEEKEVLKIPEVPKSESESGIVEKVPETPIRSSRRKDKHVPKEEAKVPELEVGGDLEEKPMETKTPSRSSRRQPKDKEPSVPQDPQETSSVPEEKPLETPSRSSRRQPKDKEPSVPQDPQETSSVPEEKPMETPSRSSRRNQPKESMVPQEIAETSSVPEEKPMETPSRSSRRQKDSLKDKEPMVPPDIQETGSIPEEKPVEILSVGRSSRSRGPQVQKESMVPQDIAETSSFPEEKPMDTPSRSSRRQKDTPKDKEPMVPQDIPETRSVPEEKPVETPSRSMETASTGRSSRRQQKDKDADTKEEDSSKEDSQKEADSQSAEPKLDIVPESTTRRRGRPSLLRKEEMVQKEKEVLSAKSTQESSSTGTGTLEKEKVPETSSRSSSRRHPKEKELSKVNEEISIPPEEKIDTDKSEAQESKMEEKEEKSSKSSRRHHKEKDSLKEPEEPKETPETSSVPEEKPMETPSRSSRRSQQKEKEPILPQDIQETSSIPEEKPMETSSTGRSSRFRGPQVLQEFNLFPEEITPIEIPSRTGRRQKDSLKVKELELPQETSSVPEEKPMETSSRSSRRNQQKGSQIEKEPLVLQELQETNVVPEEKPMETPSRSSRRQAKDKEPVVLQEPQATNVVPEEKPLETPSRSSRRQAKDKEPEVLQELQETNVVPDEKPMETPSRTSRRQKEDVSKKEGLLEVPKVESLDVPIEKDVLMTVGNVEEPKETKEEEPLKKRGRPSRSGSELKKPAEVIPEEIISTRRSRLTLKEKELLLEKGSELEKIPEISPKVSQEPKSETQSKNEASESKIDTSESKTEISTPSPLEGLQSPLEESEVHSKKEIRQRNQRAKDPMESEIPIKRSKQEEDPFQSSISSTSRPGKRGRKSSKMLQETPVLEESVPQVVEEIVQKVEEENQKVQSPIQEETSTSSEVELPSPAYEELQSVEEIVPEVNIPQITSPRRGRHQKFDILPKDEKVDPKSRRGRPQKAIQEIEEPSPLYEEIVPESSDPKSGLKSPLDASETSKEGMKSPIREVPETSKGIGIKSPIREASETLKGIKSPIRETSETLKGIKSPIREASETLKGIKSPIREVPETSKGLGIKSPIREDSETFKGIKSPIREVPETLKGIPGLKSPIRDVPVSFLEVQEVHTPIRASRRGRKSSKFMESQEEKHLELPQTEEIPQNVPEVNQEEIPVEKSLEHPKGRRSRKEKQISKQDPDVMEEKLEEIPEEKVLEDKDLHRPQPKTIPQRGNRRRSKRYSQEELEKEVLPEKEEPQKSSEEIKEVPLELPKEPIQKTDLPIPEAQKEEISITQESVEVLPQEEKMPIDPSSLSGLATLATVSESFILEQNQNQVPEVNQPPEEPIKPIPQKESPQKKVATLATFSMDFQFSDSNEGLPTPEASIQETIVPLEEEIQLESATTVISETTVPSVGGESDLGEIRVGGDVISGGNIEKPIQKSPKLLEILSEPKSSGKKIVQVQKHTVLQSQSQPQSGKQMLITSDKSLVKIDPKNSKFLIKSAKPSSKSGSKPIILSEKIIKPVTETETVSVRKVTSKRTYQDVEDIDTFIIEKPTKRTNLGNEMDDIILTPKSEVKQIKGRGSSSGSSRGKPKIIEQTIIKAADVPSSETGSLLDDAMFDINSMPIVLSDQILTPETIENMPVITDLPGQSSPQTESTILKRGGMLQQVKLLKKPPVGPSNTESPKTPGQTAVIKGIMPKTLGKTQKVYASSPKLLKSNPAVITQSGKPGKFIILPTSAGTSSPGTSSTVSKYTVGKRVPIKPEGTITKTKTLQGLSPEPSGNKIMIITNNQGEQSRVLLTPAQQKMLAGKMPTTKITKTQQQGVKGNLVQKSILTSKGTLLHPTSKTMVTQAIMTSKGQIIPTQGQTLVTSEGQVLTPLTPQQLKNIKTDPKKYKSIQQRILLPEKGAGTGIESPSSKTKVIPSSTPGKKTILLKTSGQTYKKIVESPKQSVMSSEGVSGSNSKQIVLQKMIKPDKLIPKAPEKVVPKGKTTPSTTTISSKVPPKRPSVTPSPLHTQKVQNVPPLAPITKKEVLELPKEKSQVQSLEKDNTDKDSVPQEQKHLIIQDNMGNQTTVTEGQILALPRETVDGQPQSYMLVTVDETGNLVPLSNEALMSLDPNLAQGGDLNNLVLQFDQNQPQTPTQSTTEKVEQSLVDQVPPQEQSVQGETNVVEQIVEQPIQVSETQVPSLDLQEMPQKVPVEREQQTLACNINTGETTQQLIITGDPESTQKFLESLSEGNTDLSSLLSGGNLEGNIIINADGQQILLNTGDENQILLMPSTEMEMPGTSPQIYTDQSQIKNQDILAAALADTDVFQQENQGEKDKRNEEKISTSQLSPNGNMFPVSVGNVLETSLTLGSPIMTPLEVPSSKNVKVNVKDMEPIMSQVPSSLELPITITDPSITQTVSQQVMLSNELQTNLELPISVSESIQTSEMNSPNFVYSLPNLEDNTNLEVHTSLEENPNLVNPNLVNPNLEDNQTLVENQNIVDNQSLVENSNLVNPNLGVDSNLKDSPDLVESDTKTLVETSVYNTLGGSISMPLLTDDPEVPQALETTEEPSKPSKECKDIDSVAEMTQKLSTLAKTLEIDSMTDDLDSQNADFCDSLSEPPPGMFEKSTFLTDTYLNKPDTEHEIPVSQANSNLEITKPSEIMEEPFADENSCEIPVQPQIITSLNNQNLESNVEKVTNSDNSSNFISENAD